MAISVQCACGRQLRVKDDLAGRKIRCPDCQEVLRLPGGSSQPAPVAASPPVPMRPVPKKDADTPRPQRPTFAKWRRTIRSRLGRSIASAITVAVLLVILGAVVLMVGVATARQRSAQNTVVIAVLALEGLAVLCAGIANLLFLIWLGRSWGAVPREHGGMSGIKAVGLLFVPVFNVYWMFRVIPGLSSALARALEERDPDGHAATGHGAGLAACLMCFVPGLNVLAVVPFLMWLKAADRAAGWLGALGARESREEKEADDTPRAEHQALGIAAGPDGAAAL